MAPKDQVLEVWGDLACFSRPELKVERFSYPVITPSAARGVFDAIFCKPNKDTTQAQFRWQITKIEILSFPRYIALRRNEVQETASVNNIRRWMRGTAPIKPLMADDTNNQRSQRQTMALKDVHYRLHARVYPWGRFRNRIQGLEAQFRRRASRGQCFHQPYLGLREFPAYYKLIDPTSQSTSPIAWSADLGLMLYDVFDLSRPGTSESAPSISLFQATVKDGVLTVPDYESAAVLKSEGESGG